MILIILLLLTSQAYAEDYWSDCKEAYQFCARRPYHRDCSIWTSFGRPLIITRESKNQAADTQFCKDNPWHMSCGSSGEVYGEECPIPKGSK